jgi:hypothetical protein
MRGLPSARQRSFYVDPGLPGPSSVTEEQARAWIERAKKVAREQLGSFRASAPDISPARFAARGARWRPSGAAARACGLPGGGLQSSRSASTASSLKHLQITEHLGPVLVRMLVCAQAALR